MFGFALGDKSVLYTPDHLSDTISGGYTQIPQVYYHTNPSRNALGLYSGNEVSQISGNIVDLESDMRGITRDLSRAPSKKYHPTCTGGGIGGVGNGSGGVADPEIVLKQITEKTACPPSRLVFTERSTGTARIIVTNLRHLPTSQYVSYPGVPAPDRFVQEVHGYPWRF